MQNFQKFQFLENGSNDFAQTSYFVRALKGKKVTRPLFPKKLLNFFISNFLSKFEVFLTFLKIATKDLTESPYLDRLNHYLLLFY